MDTQERKLIFLIRKVSFSWDNGLCISCRPVASDYFIFPSSIVRGMLLDLLHLVQWFQKVIQNFSTISISPISMTSDLQKQGMLAIKMIFEFTKRFKQWIFLRPWNHEFLFFSFNYLILLHLGFPKYVDPLHPNS